MTAEVGKEEDVGSQHQEKRKDRSAREFCPSGGQVSKWFLPSSCQDPEKLLLLSPLAPAAKELGNHAVFAPWAAVKDPYYSYSAACVSQNATCWVNFLLGLFLLGGRMGVECYEFEALSLRICNTISFNFQKNEN